ncbi:NAD(+) diphosphatase [Ruminococcus sp. FC2018]|uniref:NAD(+) diphosphatase n=1 Tax=Ruminococcus sp. FC2018 TaxID=1410617 RepID=UPI00048FE4CD|nr:NAD(+) diphosphatase [Ruminococcus sp. FC2018]
MFQDIPDSVDIEFDPLPANGGDSVLCFDGRSVLVRIDENRAVLPKLCELVSGIKTVFAFKADGIRFFLCLEKACAQGFEFQPLNRIRHVEPDTAQYAVVTGFHYYCFHMENKFCSVCGAKLEHDGAKRCMVCTGCGNEVYPKIAPAVILGIIDRETDSILLTRYADREYKKYALVAGFVEMGESAEAAAKREAMEETGLEITDIEYFASQPWGFAQNLLVGYFAQVKGSREIKMDTQELSEAVWVKREDVPAQPGGISLTGEMMWAFKSSQR